MGSPRLDKKIFQDAESGNSYARLGLAYMYHQGKSMDPDPELAMMWYIKSSEVGCSRAKWELAKIFRDGTIAEKDDDLFMMYTVAAAEAGVPEAKMELGMHHLMGVLIPQDEERAFEWMHSAAKQGLPMAQFMTGYMFGKGTGVTADIAEEEMWYSKLGVSGDADLFYWIGRNFEYGLFNVERDLFEAGRWYKFGADMGHEKCALCWGAVLEALEGGNEDSLEEREFKLSQTDTETEKATRDQAMALADHYLETEDYETALRYYQDAAKLGNPTAMFMLALMYHGGAAVKRSDQMALELLAKASAAGSEDAQFVLGTLYGEGRGVKKDSNEAVKYYTMAAANGYLVAFYNLTKYMDHPEVHVRNSIVVRR
jgi:FOG: TPR repeat, SEL1 subfamily